MNPTTRSEIVDVPDSADKPERFMKFVALVVSTVSGLGRRMPAGALSVN